MSINTSFSNGEKNRNVIFGAVEQSVWFVRVLMVITVLLLAFVGCGGDKNSKENRGRDYDESDFSALVGTWHDPKRNRKFSLYENGNFFEDGLHHVDEITQVQKGYFRLRPKKSNRYALFYVHNNKVLMVIGSHFDRDLNMELSNNRKLTKVQIYKQHDQLVQAAVQIEKGNLDVEDHANGYPLFEELAIRVSDKPQDLDLLNTKKQNVEK